MKKFLLTLLAFAVFIPLAFAEGKEVVSYQKLKNVTKKDHPAGSNLTMGFARDEIRFLVFVQNQTDTKKIFRVEDILPSGLLYRANTTSRYQLGSGSDWQKIPDNKSEPSFPLKDYLITIEPGVGFYFTFATVVAEDLPSNNVTLSNFVTVYNSANRVLQKTVTKVLVPNSKIKQVETNPETAVNEEEYVNQVLDEEQKFIEKTFSELEERGFEAELPQTENLKLDGAEENPIAEDQATSFKNPVWMVGVILVVLLVAFVVRRKNRF